jgi:hypothetical protein
VNNEVWTVIWADYAMYEDRGSPPNFYFSSNNEAVLYCAKKYEENLKKFSAGIANEYLLQPQKLKIMDEEH